MSFVNCLQLLSTFFLLLVFSDLSAQTVAVTVNLRNPLPFVTSLNREDVERALIDSTIQTSERYLEYFTSSFIVLPAKTANTQQIDYLLTVEVSDTTVEVAGHKNVPIGLFYAKVHEASLPTDSITPWLKFIGVSYGFDVSSKNISQEEVLKKCFAMTGGVAKAAIRHYLPLSFSRTFGPQNLSTSSMSLLEYSNSLVVEFQIINTHNEQKEALQKIQVLMANALLKKQHFYFRAKQKKRYFNYYLSFDSTPEKVVAMHPLRVTVVIELGAEHIVVRIVSDDPRIDRTSIEPIILIPKLMLDARPTWVNGKLTSAINALIDKNI